LRATEATVQYLERIGRADEATCYAIRGKHDGPVSRYVVSTPESRRICNRPEVLGVEFGHELPRAITRALHVLPEREPLRVAEQERICVAHFLRGGLNFGLRESLHQAFGYNRHSSCFMSSQRRRVDGRWQVEEDMYRKLRIPAQAVMLVGDVVATGVTVDNGLHVILEHLKGIGSSLRRMVFFTIGCHKLEKVLTAFDAEARAAFPDYEGTTAVYLEAKFKLVDSKSELRIGIPGTDLVRHDCLVAPEFALSQYDDVGFALERCAIYDAGSRAFDIPTYVADVREYWEQVLGLAEDGFTLAEALDERWPEPWRDDRAAMDAFLNRAWRGVEDDFNDRIWRSMQQRWTADFQEQAQRPEALAQVARRRISQLPEVGPQRRGRTAS